MLTHFLRHDLSVTLSRFMLLSFIAMLPFMGGCGEDDNPIIDDHDHDHEEEEVFHADADGFTLEVDGVEVYRQFQGTDSGGLTLGVGTEIEVHVVFLDPSGAEAHLGEEEEEDDHDHDHDHGEEEAFSLSLSDYDSAIIDIHLPEEEGEHAEDDHEEEHKDEHEDDHEDEHGEEESLHFEVVGLKVGTTKIRLQLIHGDHPDFTAALLIPVTVQ